MDIAELVFNPATVIEFEVYSVLKLALVTSVNVKEFGVVSAANVVVVNVSDIPPIVKTV